MSRRSGNGALVLGMAVLVGVFGYLAWKYKGQWSSFISSNAGLDYLTTAVQNIGASRPLSSNPGLNALSDFFKGSLGTALPPAGSGSSAPLSPDGGLS